MCPKMYKYIQYFLFIFILYNNKIKIMSYQQPARWLTYNVISTDGSCVQSWPSVAGPNLKIHMYLLIISLAI